MRTALLLGLVSVLAISGVACAVEEEPQSGVSRRPKTSQKDKAAAEDDDALPGDHDSDPTVGEHEVDKGNPNAGTSPTAPASTGTASSKFALALTQNTPAVDLGKDVDLDVTITPSAGFNGAVTFAVTGLPTGATAAPVTAPAGATTAKIKISAAMDAAVTATGASVPLTITGTSDGATATANANFKIAPKVTLTIPVNVDALRKAGTSYSNEWGTAFGANPATLKTQANNGIVVTVFNADSKSHIIHGANGFAHGDTNNPIQPNSFEQQGGQNRIRTLKPGTNATGYPHDGANGQGVSFHLNVGTAP